MRVNVYAEDLTNEAVVVTAVSHDTNYVGVRLMLTHDDAVTIWAETTDELAAVLGLALRELNVSDQRMAQIVEPHPPFTGHPSQPPIGEFDTDYTDPE